MFHLLAGLAILGVIGWLLTSFVPMSPGVKTVITVVIIVFAILLACQAFGFSAPLLHAR